MTENDPLITGGNPNQGNDPNQGNNPNQGNDPNPDRDSGMIDLNNRDPKHITEEVVKIIFEDVLAEPPSTQSLDCLWKASHLTFTESKNWLYGLLAAIFGIPLSLIWGLLLGGLSFFYIWLIVPCVTIILAQLHCLCRPFVMVLHTYGLPICNATASALRIVRVWIRKEQ